MGTKRPRNGCSVASTSSEPKDAFRLDSGSVTLRETANALRHDDGERSKILKSVSDGTFKENYVPVPLFAEKDGEASALTAQVEVQNATIERLVTSLTLEVSRLRSMVSDLNGQHCQLKGQIARLNGQNAQKDKEFVEQNVQLAYLTSQVSEQNIKIVENNLTLIKQQGRLDELTSAKAAKEHKRNGEILKFDMELKEVKAELLNLKQTCVQPSSTCSTD
ncbi:hypothetical protein CYMTET_41844 [Cymbomonas tetramitiformis]|uniref:Uncharacterized protein n=1 Tax=Cymbomonas tetramitiformis TaxID=36881 RepID=A0AAE0C5A0_9CHLO|nr:hypothetical protein CYMTET_41844 [Cymbomonas tetramitiformis]